MASSQFTDQGQNHQLGHVEHIHHRVNDDIDRIQACGMYHESTRRNAIDIQGLWSAHDALMSSLNGMTKTFNDAIIKSNDAFNAKFDKLQWAVISAAGAIILACVTVISNTIFHFWK